MAGPLSDPTPYQVMLPFIALAAWFGGLGPGMFTTVGATLWAVLRVSEDIGSLDHELELALFFPIGAFIAALSGSLHRAREGAEVAAEALKVSQGRYENIVETAAEGIWTIDPNFNTSFVNARLAQMLGTMPSAMVNRPLSDFLFPEDRDKPRERIMAHLEAGSYQTEGRYRRADGSELWCLVNVSILRDAGGALSGVLALHTDITQSREQSAQLRQSNERFELATRAVNGFISEWNVPEGTVWRSSGFTELLGHDLGQIPDSISWWREQIHPDDAERAEAELEAALGTSDAFAREYRARHADGSLRWLWERCLAVRDDDGAPRCIVTSVSDISERKAVEEALGESEANFRNLADSMPQIVWSSDAHGTPTYFNRRWYEYSGQPNGLIGTGSWEKIYEAEDWQRAREVWRENFESGQACRFEARLRDKNGVTRWFLFRAVPIRDHADGEITRWFGTATDIDDERRLFESQRFLADAGALFSSSLDYEITLEQVAQLAVPTLGDWCFVVLKNAQGAPEMRVAAHQESAKVEQFWQRHRPFGLDPNAPRGFAAVMRSGEPELIEEISPEVWREALPSPEYQEMVAEVGHRSTLIVPLQTGGVVLGCLGFSFAESERRFSARDVPLAQEIARRAAIAIENARLYRELQDADRRKDEFLAMLAHELRNPLAAISGARSLLDLLLEGQSKADTATPRAILERQIAQLSRLVDDLLDVSRITRGKIELRRQKCDFIEIARGALDGVRPLIAARRHELRLDFASQPLWVDADPARLGQIVANLVTNAAKYTDEGGQITVSLRCENGEGRDQVQDEAVFRVRDNGSGLRPDALASVWGLFVQSDRTLDRAQGGLGIGLTLVKSLAEMHGGRVAAHSAGLEQGSEFLVALPLLEASETAESALSTPAPDIPNAKREETATARGAANRVLLVDDNKDAAWMLAQWLESQGYDVQVAHDGAQGLFLACGWQPDIAVLDIGMPEMDGYQLARTLRERPESRAIRLIALTGYGQPADRERARQAGFNAHLTKPVSMEELQAALKETPEEALDSLI